MFMLCSFILFLFIFVLVLIYHFFLWKYGSSDVLNFRYWVSSFECGFCCFRPSECYFSYTYFVLLVFFVVFDLEVSLLLKIPYGFDLFYKSLYYLVFLLVLGLGYSVELYGGYVRWSY